MLIEEAFVEQPGGLDPQGLAHGDPSRLDGALPPGEEHRLVVVLLFLVLVLVGLARYLPVL